MKNAIQENIADTPQDKAWRKIVGVEATLNLRDRFNDGHLTELQVDAFEKVAGFKLFDYHRVYGLLTEADELIRTVEADLVRDKLRVKADRCYRRLRETNGTFEWGA